MLTIKGIYGREMYETWYKMTVMLQSGLDISPVITHRFAATEFGRRFPAAFLEVAVRRAVWCLHRHCPVRMASNDLRQQFVDRGIVSVLWFVVLVNLSQFS